MTDAVDKLAKVAKKWTPFGDHDKQISQAILAAIRKDPQGFEVFPPRKLARQQPCGCLVCVCYSDDRCNGCGAKGCGNHPVGEIPNPVFEADPLEYVKVKPLVWHASYGVLRAETPYGDYMVARGMLTFPNPMRPQQIHKDEESAQAAATADYHKRLKECFE